MRNLITIFILLCFSVPGFSMFGKVKEFKNSCRKSKGIYHKKLKCACKSGENAWYYIDPNKQSCEKAKSFGTEIDKSKLKCNLPSEWYCSKDLNPNFTEFYSEYQKKYEDNRRAHFKIDKDNYNVNLMESLKDDLKFKKLVVLFEKAQKDIVSYLERFSEETDMKKFTSTILNSKLIYGIAPYHSEFEEIHQFGGNVYIQGLIGLPLVEDFFYFTFLHELTHTIDPCSVDKYNKEYKGNPFQETLQCLHSDDSIAAKKGNVQCLLRHIEKREKAGQKVYQLTKEAIKEYNKGSVCPLTGIPSSILRTDDERCPISQINETFSDWLATEVFFEKFRDIESLELDVKISNISSFLCKKNIDINDLKKELYFASSYSGSHPNFLDRLNGLILAHPIYKNKNNCDQEDGDNFLRNNLRAIKGPEEIESYKGYSRYCR